MRRLPPLLYALAFVALVVGTAFIITDQAQPSTTTAGLPTGIAGPRGAAPHFEIEFLSGEVFSLEEHLATDGRPVFLNFWASWCFPCREEMPDIDEAAANHPEILFLGIAVEDDPGAARSFAQEIAVSYPLAIDESGTIAAKYPFFGLPTTWLISSDGTIVQQISGAIPPDTIEELVSELR